MKNNKGFSSVEIIIIVVIIGLISAMAIPAFTKVKNASLLKAGDSGERLDSEQQKRYNELVKERNGRVSYSGPQSVEMSVSPDIIKTIDIGGKSFIMLKKNGAQEIIISGESFILIPATK